MKLSEQQIKDIEIFFNDYDSTTKRSTVMQLLEILRIPYIIYRNHDGKHKMKIQDEEDADCTK
jgi:hypothetical protein